MTEPKEKTREMEQRAARATAFLVRLAFVFFGFLFSALAGFGIGFGVESAIEAGKLKWVTAGFIGVYCAYRIWNGTADEPDDDGGSRW